MRLISFALTQQQILDRTKTVTRRDGWKNLTPGTLLQPVKKAMGLKKGEKIEKLGCPIRVVSVRREDLGQMIAWGQYGAEEVIKEGFGPGGPQPMTAEKFVLFFMRHNQVNDRQPITRIEFEYAPEAATGNQEP